MSKPLVFVDGLVFENSFQIGIWRIFYEVMNRTADDVNYVLLLGSDAKQPLPENVDVVESAFHRQIFRKKDLIKRWRQIQCIKRLEMFSNAIWHSTFFSCDPRRSKKSVVHVYDLIAEHYFASSSELEAQRKLKVMAINQSTKLISISESTAKECGAFYPRHAHKLLVATLGREHLSIIADKIMPSRECSCLFVGGRGSYKCFDTVIKAVGAANWPTGLNVTVVGSPFTEGELNLMRFYKVQDRFCNVGQATDTELSRLYSTAHCFVFPSSAEGFGLPVIESQMHGCIPILSDIPVFREVAGAGAVYFNHLSPESLAAAVASLSTANIPTRFSSCLVDNPLRFSWERTAEVTLRCYQEVQSL